MVGFLNAFELTGEEPFLDAAERAWAFVERFLIDREHGEWRWRVRRDGTPIPGLPKVEPWKCPYHNSRAALETADRVARLTLSSRGAPSAPCDEGSAGAGAGAEGLANDGTGGFAHGATEIADSSSPGERRGSSE